MDVDGDVGVLLADGTDKHACGFGLEDPSHILDTDDVSIHLDDAVDEFHVVVEVVLLLRVQH